MRINVQWQDILLGVPRDPDACAVARAIKRQVPHLVGVCVSYGPFSSRVEGLLPRTTLEGWRFLQMVSQGLGPVVGQKIRFFDKWHLMRPFSFELRLEGLRHFPGAIEPPKTVPEVISELEAQMQELETSAVLV